VRQMRSLNAAAVVGDRNGRLFGMNKNGYFDD
jgi:hypothetical protein